MFVCWPKALCGCCRQVAFPKVPNSPKFPASLAMGFLEKKKNTLRNCLCPRGLRGCDSFCPRRELSDIDGSACARRPHTYTVRIGYRVTGYNDLPGIMVGLTKIKIKTSKRHSKYHYIQCISAEVIYRI